MSASRLDPLREMVTLREAVDRLLEDSFVRPASSVAARGSSFPVDVYETANDIVLEATLPGVEPTDVDITILGGTLTIKAEAKGEEEAKDRNYLVKERRPCSYFRVVNVPERIVSEKAMANFRNGVLTLSLPKAEEAKPKSIKIEAR